LSAEAPAGTAEQSMRRFRPVRHVSATPIWRELLHSVEAGSLRTSAVYWGSGIPSGDGSPVIVVPAFLSRDCHLIEFRWWLRRLGYNALPSRIGLNADCPNILARRLADSVERAYFLGRGRVHLIGHSLGGLLARAVAAMFPEHVRSVITLGSPFRGITVHPALHCAALGVRWLVLKKRRNTVPLSCYRDDCNCTFACGLDRSMPRTVAQTAIYTPIDGVVDWRFCKTGNSSVDCAVPATHTGLVCNALVYELIARRLATAPP
jgi:pimeloyl-ACP methyl ester carboxylesterase